MLPNRGRFRLSLPLFVRALSSFLSSSSTAKLVLGYAALGFPLQLYGFARPIRRNPSAPRTPAILVDCFPHLSYYPLSGMAQSDYRAEQEMEIEALQAILMDEFTEIDPSESGLTVGGRCFQILLSPQDDDDEEGNHIKAQLALIFSHTENYPDEPPLLNLKSVRGLKQEDLAKLKEKLEQEASENLGMAMVYTLVTSAKEWLTEKYGLDNAVSDNGDDESAKEDIIIPHGEPVTVETFMAWRERYEAELALERAKLLPESALLAPKEKRLSGRQWFETGRATTKGAAVMADEGSEEEFEEEVDLDDDDFEDEEDMLEHYLAERSDLSSDGSRRGLQLS